MNILSENLFGERKYTFLHKTGRLPKCGKKPLTYRNLRIPGDFLIKNYKLVVKCKKEDKRSL